MHADAFDLTQADHTLRVLRLTNPEASPDAPTVVFLHDSLGCIALWRDLPEQLARASGCHALVYDRRGYGASSPMAPVARARTYLHDEAEVLRDVLTACGIDRAILFGHSDGGSIALIAAAAHDDRIGGVITEGAHVVVDDQTRAGLKAARETMRTPAMRERLARHHGDKTDAVLSAWLDTWMRSEFQDWQITECLPQITCPVFAIQGSDDEYGLPSQVTTIVDGVSGPARAWMVPGVGHSPHKEHATPVLEASAAFLARLSPPHGQRRTFRA